MRSELSDVTPWGSVQERAHKVLIVATGPSAAEIDLQYLNGAIYNGDAFVIAVNGAVRWVKRPDAFFTLDPSPSNFELLRRRKPDVKYFAAVPPGFGTRHARQSFYKQPAPDGVTYLVRKEGDGPHGSCLGLSDRPGAIHTGNSCYGALGLAYLLRPEKIAILGLDATQEGYAHDPGKPAGTLDFLPELFASAMPQLLEKQIQVVNGSPRSKVQCFSKMSPRRALDWIVT